MSAEGDRNKPRPTVTRRIGVGLTRSNLVTRNDTGVTKTRREGLLTAPSRVVISPSSLAPRRTPSDRQRDSYIGLTNNRFGDLRKNTSSPDVTVIEGNKTGRDNDVDVNTTETSSSLGTFNAINKPNTLNNHISFEHIKKTDEPQVKSEKVANDIYTLSVQQNSEDSHNVLNKYQNQDYKNTEDLNTGSKVNVERSKVTNHDIDLEDDEEDACDLVVKPDQNTWQKTDFRLNQNNTKFDQEIIKDSAKSYYSERPASAKSYYNGRPDEALSYDSERPAGAKSYNSERLSISKSYNSERPAVAKNYHNERPDSAISYYSERPSNANKFNSERPAGNVSTESNHAEALTDIEPVKVDIALAFPAAQYSPSKDSGYGSPRIEPTVDPNPIVTGSRSEVKIKSEVKSDQSSVSHGAKNNSGDSKYSLNDDEDRGVESRTDVMSAPERPARPKSLARKQSSNLGKKSDLSLSSMQHGSNQTSSPNSFDNITYGAIGNVKRDVNADSQGLQTQTLPSNLNRNFIRGNIKGQYPNERAPGLIRRSSRRLTRQKINFKKLEEDEYIGFASLPEQVHRKAVRRGFEFTLMVVGDTGLGKSTLINSLFLMDLYKDRKLDLEDRIKKTLAIEKKELEIEEKGVKLKLTIVDTPGFNESLDAEVSWQPVVNYINNQFESYLKAETGLNRRNIQDTRVHCCLYFISPYGHGLRQTDVTIMRNLHHKVNIIPLIAKADMLTKRELAALKQKVLEEIEHHGIDIYQYPDCDSDEDEEFKQQDRQLKQAIPFAIVCSNTVVEAGGKRIRGRMYPWGIVEVENPKHSDFTKLRHMLISTHMQDLKDVTTDVHYENYRAEHITEQLSSNASLRGKLKRASGNFENPEADQLLMEKDAEIRKMQEMLAKMQAQLQNSPHTNGRVTHQV